MSYECLCGEMIEHRFPEEFVFDRGDAVFETILRGEAFQLECAHCGAVHRLEEEALFRSASGDWVLQFLPEDARDSVRAGTQEVKPGVHRLVVGYPELVEKLLLWRDGLDDRVIEYLKYGFYLQNRGYFLMYAGEEGSKLEFWVQALSDPAKVGKTGLPRDAYRQALEQVESLLDRPRLKPFLTPPRVCLRDGLWTDSPG